jgi:hypothetical protein
MDTVTIVGTNGDGSVASPPQAGGGPKLLPLRRYRPIPLGLGCSGVEARLQRHPAWTPPCARLPKDIALMNNATAVAERSTQAPLAGGGGGTGAMPPLLGAAGAMALAAVVGLARRRRVTAVLRVARQRRS